MLSFAVLAATALSVPPLRGALLGFLAVACGAFGAHALAGRLDPEQLEWWQTASHYHLAHALALALVGCVPGSARIRGLAGLAFLGGVLLFSGSLYAMALGAPRWFGAITPLGGLCFLLGWLALLGAGRSSGSAH